jgi:C-terminal processing protease CtpA/Prc
MKKLIITAITVSSLISCEKLFFDEDLASTDPFENFDYLWKECDEKYSYFELKKVDWNLAKEKYRSQLYQGMSDDSLFSVLGSLLKELKDDHTNLISNFNVSAYRVDTKSQDNFDFRIIQDHYLSDNYYVSGPFTHDFLADKQIGYVRFKSFTGQISSKNFDFVLNRYKNTKGLVLDLRENGGGAVTDVFALLSRFVDKKIHTNYSRIKTGPGHNEFGPAEPAYITPYAGIKYLKPVILLTDRGTYSAGSFTSLATKAIPNITLMGDTTGGGLGLPNGGQLPNGWRYRFSITQALTLDKDESYENGVPPDIHVLFDWNNLKKDEILEKAIEEILK